MNAQIEHNFKYHPPVGNAVDVHQEIRLCCRHAANTIDKYLPAAAGREKALALTKLEEAMMWACAGVVRHAGENESQISSAGKTVGTPTGKAAR